MVIQKEIWIDIIGHEALYQISTKGKLRSLDRIVKHPNGKSNFPIKGRFLNPSITPNGYFRYSISKEHKRTYESVHRAVAIHFIPNPENKPFVNHKNGIKTDNRVENLEWCTAKENSAHAISTGLFVHQKGEQKSQSILNEDAVLEIRSINPKDIEAKIRLQQKYGVGRTAINDVISRRRWKHVI